MKSEIFLKKVAKMVKVLVTGANGYIGRHVVDKCLEYKYDVSIVDLSLRDKKKDVICYEKDILSKSEDSDLYNLLGRPDVIIHMAWQDGFNHKADSHIMKLPQHYQFIKNMIDSGCKSISIMGSMHEVGYFEGEVNEKTPCNPLSLYGIAKNALRQAVQAYIEGKDVSLKWLRCFYVTGDDAHNKSIFAKILERVAAGEKTFPFTSGENKYDFLDINILSEYITAASVQKDISGIINICSGKAISLRTKVEEFISEKHLDIKPQYGAFPARKYDSPAIWRDPTLINKIMGRKYE